MSVAAAPPASGRMLRGTLLFVILALAAASLADLEVAHTSPFAVLSAIGRGLIAPDVSVIVSSEGVNRALLEGVADTLAFAFAGCAVGVLGGAVLAFHYQRIWVRALLSFCRSIHELFWVLLLGPLLGTVSHVCALAAIAIPYGAIFAKVYAEILEETRLTPLAALPRGAGAITRFFYVLLPLSWPTARAYTAYRFECALRSAAILGFVGIPTLGYHLRNHFSDSDYGKAAAVFYVLLLLIATHRLWIRPRHIPLWVLGALLWMSWETPLGVANFVSFLRDLAPRPLVSDMAWAPWLRATLVDQALPGVWQTLLLAQMSLVLTGLLTVLTLPFALPQTAGRLCRALVRGGYLLLRSIPEYLLAFVLMLVLGPSLLPALLTLGGHNAGLLGHVMVNAAGEVRPFVRTGRASLRYAYDLLPRLYGQIVAFLFYRWETMIRESAILGLLGVGTLGFFIQEDIALDRPDRAFALILISSGLTLAADLISRRVRARRTTRFTELRAGRSGSLS